MKNQPGPSDMLEELADKVIGQMDRLAVTSFQSALEEMVNFHRFLIEAYETHDEYGQAVSFAQIDDWGALHEEWIREYRRLFDRAATYIGRENDFVKSLAHVPVRLLPQDGRHSSPAVTTRLLDLVNILVNSLEAWLTQRRTYEPSSESDEPAFPHVAGSDKRAYEEVVISLVGAWEDTLRIVDYIFGWRSREIEPAEQWQRFAASWPFLQQHLRNSAYLLVVAVWNEDEIGAENYAEMLLRWFDELQDELEDDYHLIKTLLIPDLLDKQWNDALDSLETMASFPSLDQPSPSGVFSAIVHNALSDTIVISAGVMLGWFTKRRQGADIVPRIVSRLLRNAVPDGDTHQIQSETGFRSFCLQLIRIYASGGRFERQGYGHWLDGLVATFDSMSERRVVPGRVYSPSTRDGRGDLLMPWLACMIAQMPEEGDAEVVTEVSQLTDREDIFSHGDHTLRRLLSHLDCFKSALESEHEQLHRGVKALAPSARIDKLSEQLALTLDGIIEAIESQRRERLKSRPIDERKLHSIREQVEQALTSESGGIAVFEHFTIARVISSFPERECTVSGIEKGYLTEPEMAQEPSNIWEVVTKKVQEFTTRYVWMGLSKRPRRIVYVLDEESYLAALTKESRPMLQGGLQPVLLLRDWSDPPWIRQWFSRSGEKPEGLQVRRKSEIQTNQYIGTVNDIDVYRVSLDGNQSFLLRSDLLKKITYGSNADGRIADVEFIPGQDDQSGTLRFRFNQHVEWREDDIIVLRYPATKHDETIEDFV